MNKYVNYITLCFGVVGGLLTKFLGGYDAMLGLLLFLMCADYATGWLKAIYTKQLASKVGYKGIIKKVMLLIVVAMAVQLEKVVGDSVPIREIVIMFYVANEGLSIIENVGEVIPLPEKIKDIFVQISKDKE